MKKMLGLIVLVIFSTSIFAQDELQGKMKGGEEIQKDPMPKVVENSLEKASEIKEKNAIYIHPLSLIMGPSSDYILPMYIQLTYERSLSKTFALVFKPKVVVWNPSEVLTSYIGFGLNGGIRAYAGDFIGKFIELSLDIEYYNYSFDADEINNTAKSSFGVFVVGPMVTAGDKYNFGPINVYTDAGIGWGLSSVNGDNLSDEDKKDMEKLAGFLWDINIGVGMSF